ncbi:3-hydroxy-9,10-secoandrosta-1,3,5(10)-triene-9,17-dione monooxygenase reductase subunit [Nocardia puris]|uniref:3-hydroxy-9,10-secoandrosta-1,3,5(10)-triene-9, 17-dione monooxygenase reductase component n=1 Tax=Nocardia puris TaxID=208602 RepID=A0A366E122_9NOCA|nr:3-hydroxy-9,10-secoandrosta-1,3,5(10)-triene-9,17-dione monooxygenase reductase subunit [Nocardia puris]RBO96070.1 3-hydroxy-9,10-secoandrosta-1,3,5(10)-triene-9,17-dione monooxygenase reductase component [Nocardia puris]
MSPGPRDAAAAGVAPPAIEPRRFRNVLGQFCTGITVIAAFGPGGAPVGFACQSFAAVSLDPPLVLFCPVRDSSTWAAIEESGLFCVNILAEEQREVCARFGSREPHRFASIAWHTSARGLPLLDDALATLECSVASVADGGDHHIVVGRVLELSEPAASGRPLLYYRGRYTALGPVATSAPSWRTDLEHFLDTTTFDLWL